MKLSKKLMILGVVLTLPLVMPAQITPTDAIEQMGYGINLGNTLEPPLEGDWNNPLAEDYYFEDYAAAGFKTVRIPVRWDRHTANTSPFEVDTSWMNRVEHLVDLALAEDLFVIINAHHEDWFKVDYTNQRPRFDSIWSQIIERFQDKSEKLFFEIINEPRTHDHEGLTQAEIDELNEDILAMIREVNPTRIVIYSGTGWTSSTDMMNAAIPEDDYIMAYFHSYTPWNFAGEAQGSWGSESDIASLRAHFDEVAEWSANNDVEVLLGEWGAVHQCDFNSRMKHYYHYTQNIRNSGFASAVWDDGGQFMMYKREERQWDVTKDILLLCSSEGPKNLGVEFDADSVCMQLTWTNMTASYDSVFIERCLEDSSFCKIASLPRDTTSFIDTNLTDYGYYTYRIVGHCNTMGDFFSYPQRAYHLPTERFTYNEDPFAIPGTIEAEEYDIGGEQLSYHDTDAENQGNAFRLDEGVDIEARNDGGYQIAHIEAGEWVEYTVNVEYDTLYTIEAHVASAQNGGSFRIKMGNRRSAAIEVPNTGDWQANQIVSTRMNLDTSMHIMRLEMLNGPFNIDKLVFSIAEPDHTDENRSSFPELLLYPNPVHSVLHISTTDNQFTGLSIIDVTGNVILEQTFSGDAQLSIPMDDFCSGFYFIRLRGPARQEVYKILKQ